MPQAQAHSLLLMTGQQPQLAFQLRQAQAATQDGCEAVKALTHFQLHGLAQAQHCRTIRQPVTALQGMHKMLNMSQHLAECARQHSMWHLHRGAAGERITGTQHQMRRQAATQDMRCHSQHHSGLGTAPPGVHVPHGGPERASLACQALVDISPKHGG